MQQILEKLPEKNYMVSGSFLLDYGKILLTVSAVVNIFTIVVGFIIEVGYKKFHLNLIDEREASLKDLFQYFYNWKTILIAGFLQVLYVIVGIFLLIVPGLAGQYREFSVCVV